MSTDLQLQPTEGKLITQLSGVAPYRQVKITSQTRDEQFSSIFVGVNYSYAGGGIDTIEIAFTDIDMVVDALLEHQAAREGRLENAPTIGEAEVQRARLRREFMERRHGDE